MITVYPPGSDAITMVIPLSADLAIDASAAIWLDGIPAKVVLSSPAQITAIVPAQLAGRSTAEIAVRWPGRDVVRSTVDVVPVAPALFTADGSGQGQALALNEDGSRNDVERPAQVGSLISFYATGVAVDGNQSVLTLRIAGKPAAAEIVIDPTLPAGVVHLRCRIPDGVPRIISVPVYVTADDQISPPGVTISIR
jgi:uncharacterized protein (TIGR03437 family)